ncbi:mechanosensitive ion channel [Thiohalocapsa marina]|uniref:Small-conductance mechanosensitive channel n=1 Tax=Thiohalocapsa marina TaxID=424902 RepID=A0A5M8FGN0_9GAMM|nr:mechanosensitive ion channel family protein [Thiohalocapsa marina]KAA6184018.1 mechanosensitive ion channel [Thiohalocapsa marina]
MNPLIDGFVASHWHLLLGALVAFVLWQVAVRLLGDPPMSERFPRALAALDVLLLPSACLIAGGLLRLAGAGLAAPSFEAGLRGATWLAVYLALAWSLGHLLAVSLHQRAREAGTQRVPKLIVGLVYGVLLLFALGLFMWQRGYSFAGLWVSTGVAAAVLGLALQKTLNDLFSGIALGLEGPFKIGDWLELGNGTLGQVVDMNWRATHLRGWDNATHVIPNARLAGDAFKNLHGERHLYAPWYFVQIPADVDPRFATALLLDAAMRCESVLKFPNPVVRLADGASLPYRYMVWVHLKNYPAMFRAREELFREIHRGLQEAGIEIAPQVQEMRTRRARVMTAEPPTIALALKGLDLAANLTDDELARMASSSQYCHFNSGHVLVAEGAISDAFYIIAGGLVDTAVRLPDGTRKIVETLEPGKYFGLAAMLTPEPSFLEYVANTDVTLIRVDLDCVRDIVAARPELSDRLAAVVKARLDVAEAARAVSRRDARRLSLRDIRASVERRIRGTGRGGSDRRR